ncbi:MAG: HTH domain-containing protein, partial [Oscillospiraceae bacterium]|nr:HTH domain-containing protein [Oscillospiraceae bacterium]
LLTEKQRDCFDMHYNEDLSLSEIAEQLGISRQGVWDNIRRAESALNEIEAKTGLIRRFTQNRLILESLSEKMAELAGLTQGRAAKIVEEAARDIEAMKLEV